MVSPARLNCTLGVAFGVMADLTRLRAGSPGRVGRRSRSGALALITVGVGRWPVGHGAGVDVGLGEV